MKTMKTMSLQALVALELVACAFLFGCRGDKRTVCGPVIGMEAWGQSNVRYHALVFNVTEDGSTKTVSAHVSRSTYYATKVGDNVCFSLYEDQIK